ncbi:MAG: glutathione S-transferase family protein [Alcaligenaceae bacterium]|nr:MAG: glutathione S-transferase family protein [Alcaligenaceae bacterium]
MSLILHYHPLSSCCHKTLIALYELGVEFEPRLLNLGDPAQRNDFMALWPTGKMPLLQDGFRVVPETSIIIEYLVQRYAPSQALIPPDVEDALEVRLLDRLSDLYLMTPMQAIVGDRLRAEEDRDSCSVEKARATLSMAYGLLDQKLIGRRWIAGDGFSMADCAVAPALFFASTLVPIPDECQLLSAYFDRLMERPSVARMLDEARPFFEFYPYREAIPARFLNQTEA